MGIHPAAGTFEQRHGDAAITGSVLYLMCNDIRETVLVLQSKDINCSPLQDEDWGTSTTLTMPSGGKIGLYEPKHKLAID